MPVAPVMPPEALLLPAHRQPSLREQGLRLLMIGRDESRLCGDYYDPDFVRHFTTEHYSPLTNGIMELLARLPEGWKPDYVLVSIPEFMLFPSDLERCPYPLVGLVSDWNLGLRALAPCLDLFDCLLVDAPGVAVLERLGYTRAHYWPLYSYTPADYAGGSAERPYDVTFIGNLNPQVQRVRNRYLYQLAQLADEFRIHVPANVYGADYVRTLQQSKIVFNHCIRGELNLRCYEAPAAGALVFIEASNQEARWLLRDGIEGVYYTPETLLPLLRHYLTYDAERAAIAQAGCHRVQGSTYTDHFSSLLDLLSRVLPDRAVKRSPIHLPSAQHLTDLAKKAYTSCEGDRIRLAEHLATKALQSDPAFAPAHATLAAVYANASDQFGGAEFPAKASQHAISALQSEPNLPVLCLNIARFLMKRGEDPELTRSLLERVLTTSSADPSEILYPSSYTQLYVELEALFARTAGDDLARQAETLALTRWQAAEWLGDLETEPAAQLNWYRLATELRPDLAATQSKLGNVQLQLGEWEPAAMAFRLSLADNPFDFAAIAGLLCAQTALGQRAAAADLYRAYARVYRTVVMLQDQLGPLFEVLTKCSAMAPWGDTSLLGIADLPAEVYLLRPQGDWLPLVASYLRRFSAADPVSLLLYAPDAAEAILAELAAWLEAAGLEDDHVADLLVVDTSYDWTTLLTAVVGVAGPIEPELAVLAFEHGCRLIRDFAAL